jgi:hypothetical protein
MGGRGGSPPSCQRAGAHGQGLVAAGCVQRVEGKPGMHAGGGAHGQGLAAAGRVAREAAQSAPPRLPDRDRLEVHRRARHHLRLEPLHQVQRGHPARTCWHMLKLPSHRTVSSSHFTTCLFC